MSYPKYELKYFSTANTNMFPMANSVSGGQLVTEFNLMSNDSVMTTPSIEYKAGSSYVHSENDFNISYMGDSPSYFPQQTTSTETVLQVSAGKAVVNGYFVQSFVDIIIDLISLNANREEGEEPLIGDLAIGLKTFFSDDQSSQMFSSILVEQELEDTSSANARVYAGIQIIILPASEVRTPRTIIGDVNYGEDGMQQYCNMDLLLGTFSFDGAHISNITPNPKRLQCIPSVRIEDIDGTFASSYVRKSGLQQNKFYTFAGKGDTDADTWCDSTDAIMVWDSASPRLTSIAPAANEKQAKFEATSTGVNLFIPHKQIDSMQDGQGNRQYFQPVRLPIPAASFSTGGAGIVTPEYTAKVQSVLDQIQYLQAMPGKSQRAFIDVLDDRSKLPPVDSRRNMWSIGDYVVVGQDNTVRSSLNDAATVIPPSTMYIVIPPRVTEIDKAYYDNPTEPRSKPSGTELNREHRDQIADNITNPLDPSYISVYWPDPSLFRGSVEYDYFTLEYVSYDENNVPTTHLYYFPVKANTGEREYSDPVFLTGEFSYATTDIIGGFLDVDTSQLDQGYVYLDGDGHLRLLDYGLLRTGVLAYQLGEDFTMPSGLTYSEIQANLDEYINERVAFPNSNQITNAAQSGVTPYIININLSLPKSDEEVTVHIHSIDSRFGSVVMLNLSGDADSNTTVLIESCQHLKINTTYTSGSGPVIAINNVELCYDADILDRISSITDLSLWYARFNENDLYLSVNGMTVSGYLESDDGLAVENIDYWSSEAINDNHIQIALQSITFAANGNIIGCGLLVRNLTTDNVQLGKSLIIDTFTLPNLPNILPYPSSKLTQKIQVTGQFMVAYPPMGSSNYICADTKFTATTQYVTMSGSTAVTTPGELAVMQDSYVFPYTNPTTIDGWSPDTYHLFTGAVNSI